VKGKHFWTAGFLFCAAVLWAWDAGNVIAGSRDSDFLAARDQMNRGEIEPAGARMIEKAAARVSPGLLHNLGNAEYKLGHLGAAVLAWERARALDPSFRNTVANLRFARGEAGLEEPQFFWTEKYSAWLTPDTWLWLATAAFWAAVALLALPGLLRWKRNAWTQGGAVLALAVLLCTLPALVGLRSRSTLGVVLAQDPDLRLTPTREGEVLGRLSAGELARVEKSRGEYAYVRAVSDRAGWVRWDEFAKIWP
jgi:hypothetical protein